MTDLGGPRREPIGRRQTVHFLVSGAAVQSFAMLPVFLVGGFAPQLRDALGMTTGGLAVGVALFFATSAVTSAPLGRLVERAGLRLSLSLLTAVGVGGLLAMATVVDSATGLYAALAMGGVANAFASSTVNALLAQGIRQGRLGLAFGVKQASIPTATLLTGLAIPPFASGANWHYVFVVAAVGTAVAGLTAPAPRMTRIRGRGQQKLVDVPRLLLFAAVGAVGAGVANAFAILLVDFTISEGYSQETAGHLLLTGSLVGIAVRLSAGLLVDRRQFRGILGVGALMAAGGFGFLLLAGFGGQPALLTLGVALGFGAGWGWPGLFHYAVARSNPSAVATATGMVQAGVYAGCVAGPLCVGYLASEDRYRLAWFGSAAAMFLCAAICVATRPARRGSRRRPADEGRPLVTGSAGGAGPASRPATPLEPLGSSRRPEERIHVKPLSDIRIIAVEQYGAGPFGTLHLADLGAEVIKIEDPSVGGDVGRYTPPYAAEEDSLFFEAFNRNKRSMSLDLGRPEGRHVFEDLVRRSDVVYSNLRGDVPAKMRIRYDDLKHLNERVVCCSLSGFGMTGPRSAQPGYDYILQGLAGWMSVTGEPGGPPTKAGLSLVDYSGGLVGAMAVLAGVHSARRDGRGMDCDLSLYDTSLSLLTYLASWHLNTGYVPERTRKSAHPSLVPFQLFEASDGWVVVGCAKEKFWVRLLDVLGRTDLAADERFRDFGQRHAHRDALLEILEPLFRERPVGAWLSAMTEAGIPSGPVYSVPEALNDEHAAARGMVVSAEHPRYGTVRQVASPLKVGGQPVEYRRAPQRGEDNDRVLRDLLGYDDGQIADLTAKGAFG